MKYTMVARTVMLTKRTDSGDNFVLEMDLPAYPTIDDITFIDDQVAYATLSYVVYEYNDDPFTGALEPPQ
jgi:cell division protein FtsX